MNKIQLEDREIRVSPHRYVNTHLFEVMVYWKAGNGVGKGHFETEAAAIEWAKAQVRDTRFDNLTWEQVTCNGRYSCD